MSKRKTGKHISGDPRKNGRPMYYKGFVARDVSLEDINFYRDVYEVMEWCFSHCPKENRCGHISFEEMFDVWEKSYREDGNALSSAIDLCYLWELMIKRGFDIAFSTEYPDCKSIAFVSPTDDRYWDEELKKVQMMASNTTTIFKVSHIHNFACEIRANNGKAA